MFEFDSDDLDWVLGELRTAVESSANAKQLLIDHAPELVAASLRFFAQWHVMRKQRLPEEARQSDEEAHDSVDSNIASRGE